MHISWDILYAWSINDLPSVKPSAICNFINEETQCILISILYGWCPIAMPAKLSRKPALHDLWCSLVQFSIRPVSYQLCTNESGSHFQPITSLIHTEILIIDFQSFILNWILTDCGLVTLCDDINLGVHSLMAPNHYLNKKWRIYGQKFKKKKIDPRF